MNTAKEAWTSLRADLNEQSTNKEEKLVSDKKEEYHKAKEAYNNEHRAEYKVQVQKAEENGDTDKAGKLREEYKRLFSEELPLPEEEKPKTSGQGLKDKEE